MKFVLRIAVLVLPLLFAGSTSATATQVINAPCPYYVGDRNILGCADFDHDTIYVALHRPAERHALLLHEWGHFFDHDYLDDSERSQIERVLHWPQWEPEHFADQFAACHMSDNFRHRVFPLATWGSDPRLCRLLPLLR